MPKGRSGRIVIEIDPEKKQEIYAALGRDGSCMKQWFLERVNEYLQNHGQLSLPFIVNNGNEEQRQY